MIDLSAHSSATLTEAFLAFPFYLMGLSHILQPKMWRDFFTGLHEQGPPGVIVRTFALELWPAMLVLVFHRVWSGHGIVVTIYGHLLTLKIVLGLLYPPLGLRSLAMAESKGDKGFIGAGFVLLALGGVCTPALLEVWRW
ncbi:MAG: hypothetical protein VX475_13795 [Myxococcota bacterium]|nr:hypothetical protein [Myxococcota bacterium]